MTCHAHVQNMRYLTLSCTFSHPPNYATPRQPTMQIPAPLLLAILQTIAIPGHSLRAYDCNHPNASYLALSLKEPAECAEPAMDYEERRTTTLAILQTTTSLPVTGYRCLLVKTSRIFGCTSTSVTYGSIFTRWMQEEELSVKRCREAVQTGQLMVQNTPDIFIPIRIGEKISKTYNSQGSLDNELNCYYWNDVWSAGKTYKYSVERVMVTITIDRAHGIADLATDEIYFPRNDNIRAPYSKGHLKDQLQGTIYWTPRELECEDTASLIYQGAADLYVKRNGSASDRGDILIINNKESRQYAGLVVRAAFGLCHPSACFTTHLENLVACIQQPAGDKDYPLPFAFLDHVPPENVQLQSQLGFQHLSSSLHAAERFSLVQDLLCINQRRTLWNKLQAVQGTDNPYVSRTSTGQAIPSLEQARLPTLPNVWRSRFSDPRLQTAPKRSPSAGRTGPSTWTRSIGCCRSSLRWSPARTSCPAAGK